MSVVQKLIPASELRRLSTGSLEQKLEAVGTAVLTFMGEAFGAPNPQVLATYSDHAVVRARGSFHRVSFEESDSGEICILESKPLEVETFDSSSELAAKEAEQAVRLFFHGSLKEAQERVKNLVPLVRSDRGPSELQRVEGLQIRINTDRPWRRLFEERRSQIEAFVAEDLELLEAHRPEPKFRVLYLDEVDSSRLAGYAELVNKDLDTILDRLESIRESTQTEFRRARPVLRSKGDTEVFPLYEQFAEDLLEDLRSVSWAGVQASFDITGVPARGKLRDTLAESIHSYEVAGRFVVAVAQQLLATAQ